jgi:hypothetical protein
MKSLGLAVVIALGFAGYAQAQERVVIDEDGMPVARRGDPDVMVAPRERVRRRARTMYRDRYEPPVYGWVERRPVNCGTFHYWDGDSCADARDRVDPK